MWSLQSIKDENCRFYFLCNTNYSVGRKNVSVLLPDDASISRHHATLHVINSLDMLDNSSCSSSFILTDEESKYGTFVNREKITHPCVKLCENDIIKFGQFSSEFKVCFRPLIIATSCVEAERKNELGKLILSLGGFLVPEWKPSCTHLVMSDVKITVKALCCLVSLKPLVTIEYFSELAKYVANKAANAPQEKDFVPPVGELVIDETRACFDVVLGRKTLFRNKTFIFVNEEQLKKLHLAITTAGGRTALLEKIPLNPRFLIRPGSCVIRPVDLFKLSRETSNLLETVSNFLNVRRKRVIPEREIGLAVTYCSVAMYCNPDVIIDDPVSGVRNVSAIPSQTFSQNEVYVEDTDEVNQVCKRARVEGVISANEGTSSNQVGNQTLVEDSQNAGIEKERKMDSDDDEISEVSFIKRQSEENSQKKSDMFADDDSDVSIIEVNDEANRFDVIKKEFGDEKAENGAVMSVNPGPSFSNVGIKRFHIASSRATETKAKNPSGGSTWNTSKVSEGTTNGLRCSRKPADSSAANFEDSSEDLPKNLMTVQYADLVKPNSGLSVAQDNTSLSRTVIVTGKNFKRFKKTSHVGSRALPQIIGGSDLIPDNPPSSSRSIDEWIMHHPEEEQRDSQEGNGEFDTCKRQQL